MKLVVDTNIVISAIISDKGKIGQLLLNKPVEVQFFSPMFLLDELNKHSEKILSITGYSEADYRQIKSIVTRDIEFLNLKTNNHNWEIAYQLLNDIDENDIPFLALNIEIDGFLWTGDKKMIRGLQNKSYTQLVTTDMLYSKYFEF